MNKFAVASDLSLAGQISKEDMALYLRDEILAAISKNQIQGTSCNFKSNATQTYLISLPFLIQEEYFGAMIWTAVFTSCSNYARTQFYWVKTCWI